MDLLTVHKRAAEADTGEEVSRGARVRALLAAALGPLVTGYAVVAAVLALVTAIASSARFSASGVLLIAGPSWLATYQVPLDIHGEPLGVLPLLPTAGVCLLIARTAAGAAQRLRCTEPAQAGPVIGVIAGAHALAGMAVSVLSSGASLSVEPLAAFVVPALVAAASAVAGVARRCGFLAAARRYLDPLAIHGLRAGALGLGALLAAGAVTFLAATLLSTPTINDLFARNAPGAGSGVGMLLLSLGYVPNAVAMALGFATGPGFSIGSVEVSPFSFTGGGVPGMPLLGAIPEAQAGWWPVFLLLPIAAGALVGWTLRRCHEDPLARLRTVGVAGALVGFGTVVVGTLSGGRLANGPFDPVSVPLGLVSIAAFVWIAVPGCLVAWFAGPHERAGKGAEPEAAEAGEAPTDTVEPEEPEEPGEDQDAAGEPTGDEPAADEPEDDDFEDDPDDDVADGAEDEDEPPAAEVETETATEDGEEAGDAGDDSGTEPGEQA